MNSGKYSLSENQIVLMHLKPKMYTGKWKALNLI